MTKEDQEYEHLENFEAEDEELLLFQSQNDALMIESEEYKKCLSDATQMTTTIHQYGNVCRVVTKS